MDFHIIITGIEDDDAVEALGELLAGEGGDTSPALEIERVVRGLGDEYSDAEFMEYATEDVDGDGLSMRNWL